MKKLTALTLALFLFLTLFVGCKNGPASSGAASVSPDAELAVPVPEGVKPSEDNARVFYEIFVGSFSDSDGDGIGDLRGIINRMDYLNDGSESSGKSLGVEGLWLTPIFPSDSYHKYDADDYCAVDGKFGTTDDLKELAELCHSRNVKLILDFAINHTSRNHQWFQRFAEARKNGAADDPYYDYYSCYTEGEPVPDGRVFARLAGTDVCYECNFWDGMPELNFDNPAVRQAVLDAAKFWLDLGVDGFRFDAAKYVYYGDHASSVEFWTWYLNELRAVKPDLYTVAEVWDTDNVTQAYYPAVNCFNFTAAQAEGLLAEGVQGNLDSYISYVDSYLDSIDGTNPDAMYVPFIANHDTDRCAGYLPSRTGSAQMAANLLLLGPGSPFLYYGEEIGMRGSRGGDNTDANRRLAMVWGDGDTVRDPVGTTYPAENRADAPVTEQIAGETSLYTHYKNVILLRKANPEIARGDYTPVNLSDSRVGGFLSDWNGSRVLVIHNPSGSPVSLDLAALDLGAFTVLSGSVGMNDAALDGSALTIGAQTSVVLR